MEITDEHKKRLDKIYSDAIEGIAGDISNERIWANGSPDEQSAQMHLDNIEELELWQENLETIKDNIGKVPAVGLSEMQKAWLEELYDVAIRESEDDGNGWIDILEELKDNVKTL